MSLDELYALVLETHEHLLWLRQGGALGLPLPPPGSAAPPRRPPPAPILAAPAPAPEPPARRPAPAPPAPRPLVVAQPPADLDNPFPLAGAEGLARIREVLGACTRCKLCHGRNQIVFGQGSATPSLVFVGEGPGADEDRSGLAFVGAAGELLTKMIGAMGLRREEVFICNVVKCRPPGNRTPEPDEIGTCSPFLVAQLQALRPKVLVALGRTPTHFLLRTTAPISRLRGKWARWEGVPVMPTYHPAYLLRTPSAKREAWADLQLVMEELKLK